MALVTKDRLDGHDRPTGPRPDGAAEARLPDPRGVRITTGSTSAHLDLPPLVVEPPAIPLAPSPRGTGRGVFGGITTAVRRDQPAGAGFVLVDGEPVNASLEQQGRGRAVLSVEGDGSHRLTIDVSAEAQSTPSATRRYEVVVDGWRIDLEAESERRAALRERASRGREEAGRGGPTEVHAIIPGVVVSVSVVAGDDVTAGQQLLVVEAMKMQNELRAPRDGRIERVAVAAGQTIEVGNLLLVIQ